MSDEVTKANEPQSLPRVAAEEPKPREIHYYHTTPNLPQTSFQPYPLNFWPYPPPQEKRKERKVIKEQSSSWWSSPMLLLTALGVGIRIYDILSRPSTATTEDSDE